MENVQPLAEFARMLTEAQQPLHIYLFALLGNDDAAKDVLQETNISLWRHAAEYDNARPFLPCAKAFAFSQVRKRRLYEARERGKVVFSSPTVEAVSALLTVGGEKDPETVAILRESLARMNSLDRECVEMKYFDGLCAAEIARRLGLTVSAVTSRLFRARAVLAIALEEGLKA